MEEKIEKKLVSVHGCEFEINIQRSYIDGHYCAWFTDFCSVAHGDTPEQAQAKAVDDLKARWFEYGAGDYAMKIGG